MTRVVFLVPRRADEGHRDALWKYARRRWETLFPDWPIYEGHHDSGSFNRSAAVNLAAELADEVEPWDVAVVIDSDVVLRRSAVAMAVARAEDSGLVVWPHTRWRGLSELATKRIIDDRRDLGPEIEEDTDVLVEKTNPVSWSCCIAIPRVAWDRLGGFDERFRGWGYEDMAFQSAVVGLIGFERVPTPAPGEAGFGTTDVYHLWHPRTGERIAEGAPSTTAAKDYVANARLGRRYMVALRRDHNRHDRPGPEWMTSEEREQDIANLVRDEARFSGLAVRHGLPPLDGWWPTLEELVEGAKAERKGEVPGVALIVRTGGETEVADQRLRYLEESIASLVERVQGNITRRVIYADWDDSVRPRVDEIAARHGFYVVGSGHHGYTEAVRRLWRYIGARVTEPYVFLTEDDFLYLRDVDLGPMVETLRRRTALRQLALLREPAYPRELEPGDHILGWDRSSFEEVDQDDPRYARLEHRLFWTMNPSLLPKDTTRTHWPTGKSSERLFGDAVLRDPRARFAFVGTGEPWARHIGEVRSTDAY